MANPEHLALLNRGVEAWNAWRREHVEIWPELSGANLSRTMLRGVNFQRADLRRATLRGANFQGANLSGADLYGADLARANLNGADLRRATLKMANLNGADLSGADLRGVIGLTRARLDEAVIDGDTELPAVDEW